MSSEGSGPEFVLSISQPNSSADSDALVSAEVASAPDKHRLTLDRTSVSALVLRMEVSEKLIQLQKFDFALWFLSAVFGLLTCFGQAIDVEQTEAIYPSIIPLIRLHIYYSAAAILLFLVFLTKRHQLHVCIVAYVGSSVYFGMAFGVCLAVLVGGYVVPTSVTLYLGFSFYLIFGALTIPIPARQLSGLRPQVSAAQVNSTRVAALALVAVVGRLVPVSPVTPLLLSMALSMVVLYYTDLMNELLTSWVITTLVGFDYENLSLYWAEGVTFNEDFAVVDTTLLVRAYVWASAQVVLDSWFGLTPELTATRAASNTKCVD